MWKNAIALFFLVALIMVVGNGNCQTEKRSNTLIFTVFDTTSAGSYAYLRDSVRGIMTSRLAAKPGVAILDRALSEQELAALKNRQPGEKVKGVADYLVSGGLYGLKSGLSIQVTVYPIATEKEVLRFEKLVKNQDNLLPELERLVGEIALALGSEAKQAPVPGTLPAGGGEGVSAFVTAHPEAAYKKSQHTGVVAAVAGSKVEVKAKEGKKNLSFNGEIRAFAAGDVDGDGEEEMVVLSGTTLELYRLGGKSILKAGGAKLSASLECHALNLADLDSDGNQEIYLSCTDNLDVSSVIVDWQQATSQFVITAENIPWYIRPLSLPGKGWRLAGQKRGFEKTELLKAGVYLLEQRDGRSAVEAERLPLPKGVNLFDFVYADLDGDRSYETIAVDGRERMKVYSSTNELLWVSKNNYGGSKVYLGPSRGGAVSDQDRKNFTVDEDFDRQMYFVPGRLLVSDVDGDGREEVVVNQNSKSVLSFLEKVRIYNDGVVVGLAWDGEAMVESWRSGTFRGYIVGFSLSAKTPGGRWRPTAKGGGVIDAGLSVAHLPQSGSWTGLLPGAGETQLTVYELQFSPGKTK